jgi:hypothetical protein
MGNSQQSEGTSGPAPDFLAHLEQAFGWSERQALDLLGTYMMSTEAGRALSNALASRNRDRRAA